MTATCVLTGKVVNAGGVAVEQTAVRAVPVVDGNGEIITSDGSVVTEASVETFTDPNGLFSMALLIGVEFIITIETTGYSRRKLIPDAVSVDIKDL